MKKILLTTIIAGMVFSHATFATDITSAEFFASNNTGEISLPNAYDRLTGKEQQTLQNNIIKVMQHNHIEQGSFADILGTYRMSNDQNITADNTESFTTSPYQTLSDEKIFSIAKELAIKLKQDSIAVILKNTNQVGLTTVQFNSHLPSINEALTLIQKLPATYNQAFSLKLDNEYAGYDNAKVLEIKWLGSKINANDIKKAFPLANIILETGNAYLVYQNGQKELL